MSPHNVNVTYYVVQSVPENRNYMPKHLYVGANEYVVCYDKSWEPPTKYVGKFENQTVRSDMFNDKHEVHMSYYPEIRYFVRECTREYY